MKITLKNVYLVPSINLLQKMSLKGQDTLARSKFVKLLKKSLDDLAEAEQELVNEYGARKDNSLPVSDDNPLITKPDGNAEIQSAKKLEFNKVHADLLNQEAEIQGGTYVNHIDDIKRILKEYGDKTELSNADAEAYLELTEAFVNATKEDK